MAAVAILLGALVVLVARIFGLSMRSGKAHRTSAAIAVPTPPGLPLLGHIMEFIAFPRDRLLPKVQQFIDGRTLCQMSALWRKIIFVSEPSCIVEVLRRKEFDDKSVYIYDPFNVAGRTGLVHLGGAKWKEHRRWLNPGFYKGALDSFGSDFNFVARDFLKTVPTDSDADVMALVQRAVASAFMRSSLGGEWDDKEQVETFITLGHAFFRSTLQRILNPLLWSDRVFRLTPKGRSLVKTISMYENFIQRIITRKREALKNKTDPTKPKTLIDVMMDTPKHQEQVMPDEEIRDELKTFFVAAADTSSLTMSWALKILSLLPEVQECLYAELDEVFGDSSLDKDIGIEDIPKLKYMERFFKEVLRMYPVFPLIGRECYNDTDLGGYRIPANSTIVLNVFSVHRDPRYWPEPGRFDPDRFLPDNAKDRPPGTYLPFSGGSRNCIGGKYSMQLMTILLATILRAFTVHPSDDGHKDLQSLTDHMEYFMLLGLRGGFHVRFRTRVAAL